MNKVKNKKSILKLYKYCKLPTCDHWDNLLSQIKFTKLSDLNDPFEGFLRSTYKNDNNNFKKVSNALVASFTTIRPYSSLKNIYMWSHYADALSGICLEYEQFETVGNIHAEKIDYTEVIDGDVTCFKKSKTWKVENEFRFQRNSTENKADNLLYVQHSECGIRLSKVYLGVRSLEKDKLLNKTEIYNRFRSHPFKIFIEKKYPEVELEVCVRRKSEFKIIRLNHFRKII